MHARWSSGGMGVSTDLAPWVWEWEWGLDSDSEKRYLDVEIE